MIALYIILGIILLICMFMLLRVKLIIRCEDELNVYLRFSFIKFNLLPEMSEIRKKKKKRKKKTKTSVSTENTENTEQKKEDGIIKKLWAIRKILLYTIEKFLGKLHFKFIRLSIVVGCENAASTALLYGATTQGVAYLIEILDNISNVDISKRSEISVRSDFINQKSSIDGKIVLYISVAHILYVLIHFLKQSVKSKLKMGE